VCRCNSVLLRFLENLGIEHWDTFLVQCAKRGELQMNCLSSEDLKEERDCSLTLSLR